MEIIFRISPQEIRREQLYFLYKTKLGLISALTLIFSLSVLLFFLTVETTNSSFTENVIGFGYTFGITAVLCILVAIYAFGGNDLMLHMKTEHDRGVRIDCDTGLFHVSEYGKEKKIRLSDLTIKDRGGELLITNKNYVGVFPKYRVTDGNYSDFKDSILNREFN